MAARCVQHIFTDKAEAFTQYMKARQKWAEVVINTPKYKMLVKPFPPPPDIEAVYGQWKITLCEVTGRHTWT